jgi:hypothetical protein
MSGFVAIILICQMSLPADACDEASARDVMSVRVDNEIGCTNGWQDVVARSPLADDIGKGSYVKTICRRTELARRATANENARRTKALIRAAHT